VSYFEDADTIKPQDLRTWYFRTLSNNLGEQAAWNWIRNEWQWLEDTVGGDMEFTSYITVTARALHTEQRLAEFKEFFEPKLNTPELTRDIVMDTNVTESRVGMSVRQRDAVAGAIMDILSYIFILRKSSENDFPIPVLALSFCYCQCIIFIPFCINI